MSVLLILQVGKSFEVIISLRVYGLVIKFSVQKLTLLMYLGCTFTLNDLEDVLQELHQDEIELIFEGFIDDGFVGLRKRCEDVQRIDLEFRLVCDVIHESHGDLSDNFLVET